MKTIKNHPSTEIKIRNQEKILKALLAGNKTVRKIEEEAKISHQSSWIHLTDLEKRGLIMRVPSDNSRFKIYSLTPQGFLNLNQLDNGLKFEYSLFQLQMALLGRVWIALAQDRRLPECEYANIKVAVFDKLLPSLINKDQKFLSEYRELINEIHSRNNINPPYQPHAYNLDNLIEFVGEIILYLTARAVQDNNPEHLQFLQYLPQWYVELMKTNTIDMEYVISSISIREELEDALSAGKNFTLQDYKNFSHAIEKFKEHQQNSTKV